jgi:hypothetical protein
MLSCKKISRYTTGSSVAMGLSSNLFSSLIQLVYQIVFTSYRLLIFRKILNYFHLGSGHPQLFSNECLSYFHCKIFLWQLE